VIDTFECRLSYGQKFENRLVDLFIANGFQSGILEFKSAQENAENGDIFVKTKDNNKIRLEAKYTCKIALKSIERFNGSFFLLTPFSQEISPSKITEDKIFVIPRRAVINYKNALVKDNHTFKLPSGDLCIELNLGQHNNGFEFEKKISLAKFIENDLLFL